MRWLNLLVVLLTNGVPLYGVKVLDWSVVNVLVLYWVENLLTAIFTCVRIVAHRAVTHDSAYAQTADLGLIVNGKPSRSGLLGGYATFAFVFTLVHGLFVFFLVFAVGQNDPDDATFQFSAGQLRQGVEWIALTLGVNLIVDLAGIGRRSYAQVERYVQSRMSQVIVLHLTIIVGMFAMIMMEAPIAILYALIAIKTLAELAAAGSRSGETPAPALATGKPVDRR